MEPGATPPPSDRILCQGRFYRYLVACLHNCTQGFQCREFWQFFRDRNVTPMEWASRHGLGRDIMKRIVFDCDRCGKKEIGEPWSVFRTSGDCEGERIPPDETKALIAKAGPIGCSDAFVGGVLDLLHAEHGWDHFCEPCFRKVAGLAGAIVGKPATRPVVAMESAMSPAAKALVGTHRPQALPLVPEPEEDRPKAKNAGRRG